MQKVKSDKPGETLKLKDENKYRMPDTVFEGRIKSTVSTESDCSSAASTHEGIGSSRSLEAQSYDFKVRKEISRGTMSTVFFCEGDIALKCMGDTLDEYRSAVYENDLTVLGKVADHPYIVQLRDKMEESKVIYSGTKETEIVRNCQVLEALQGGELSYHILRHGPFGMETARTLLI